MSTNPRPRPALGKAPNEGHPAAIDEPTPKKAAPKQATTKEAAPKQAVTKQSAPKKRAAKGTLGTGSTSDTLRGKGKKTKTSTLRDSEVVDVTVALPRSLRKRLRSEAKAADITVDEYLAALLDSNLP
jgi:hypothetical protein